MEKKSSGVSTKNGKKLLLHLDAIHMFVWDGITHSTNLSTSGLLEQLFDKHSSYTYKNIWLTCPSVFRELLLLPFATL